jgi:hypothetical protein
MYFEAQFGRVGERLSQAKTVISCIKYIAVFIKVYFKVILAFFQYIFMSSVTNLKTLTYSSLRLHCPQSYSHMFMIPVHII